MSGDFFGRWAAGRLGRAAAAHTDKLIAQVHQQSPDIADTLDTMHQNMGSNGLASEDNVEIIESDIYEKLQNMLRPASL